MCGRISTGDLNSESLASLFDLLQMPPFERHFNLAPSQSIPVIRQSEQKRTLSELRWGLLPHWLRDPESDVTAFNARLETVAEKPFFREAFRKRRCIIPASGFYEWQQVNGAKQPYYIFLEDRQPLALAGLWEEWRDPNGDTCIGSCTILTRPARGSMASIHQRMPVLLESRQFAAWLDPEPKHADFLHDLLDTDPRDQLVLYPVSTHVNSVRHDDPRCVEPLESPEPVRI